MMYEDKENYAPNRVMKQNNSSIDKAEAKQSYRPTGKSTFGRLMSEAKNELIVEHDEKVAVQSHVDEVMDMALGWVQEDRGKYLSQVDNVSFQLLYRL